MNKTILTLLLISLLIIPAVAAKDVAYILKSDLHPNAQFIQALTDLGYSYDLIDDSKVASTNFSKYSAILVGDEKITNAPVNSYKTLIVGDDYSSGWSGGVGSIASSQPLRVVNANRTHPIMKNLPVTDFQVYTEARFNGHSIPMYYLSGRTYSVQSLATEANDDSTRPIIAVKDSPKRVFFGVIESEYWTSNTNTMFKNSLKYLVEDSSPPIFSGPIPAVSWQEGTTTQLNLSRYFSDRNRQPLTFGVFNTSDEDGISINITGEIVRFSSESGFIGTDWVVFYASNGNGITKSNVVILNVSETPVIPGTPVLSYIGNKVIMEAETLEFVLSAFDSDVNDTLTFTSSSIPSGAAFTDNHNRTAKFSWVPNGNQSGTYPMTFTVRDSSGMQDSETLTISVTEFVEPPKPKNFSDVDLCTNISNKIKLTIKEPGKNDDFNVGDEIDGTIKIKNSADEDLDFDVEYYLYDLDDDEQIDDTDDSIDVDESDTEELDFVLKVPTDIDEKNDFVILINANGENDNEFCTYEFIPIDIKRDKNKLSEEVSPGETLGISIKVQNIGSKDQTLYIQAENKELGISEKTPAFDLEKFDEDDSETKLLYLQIPAGAKEKDYELVIRAISDDAEDSETVKFTVKKATTLAQIIPGTVTYPIIKTNGYQVIVDDQSYIIGQPIYITGTPAASSQDNYYYQKSLKVSETPSRRVNQINQFSLIFPDWSQDEILLIVDIFLIIGIIIEIVLIVKVRKRLNGSLHRRR